MRISEIKIDEDFKRCLPDLTVDEYTNLEKSIIKNGVISPFIIWNGYLVDGHNRYAICKAHSISEVPTRDINVDNKDGVLEWILSHQLARRNLTDHQRNVIALRYEEVIRERMRAKQSAAGGDKRSEDAKKNAVGQMNKSDKTSTRKELAQIAGTSESSIRRSKLILEHGTEEEQERAMRGGKGNAINTIANEIKAREVPHKICTKCGKVYPITMMTNRNGRGDAYICNECNSKRMKEYKQGKRVSEYESINKTVERIKSGECETYTRDDVLEELKRVAEGMKQTWDEIIAEHPDITENDDTILVDAFAYLGDLFREDKKYEQFIS